MTGARRLGDNAADGSALLHLASVGGVTGVRKDGGYGRPCNKRQSKRQ